MKVILTESVENLGGPGETVQVRPGFARNYLLPFGKALRATPENEAHYAARREHYEQQNASRRDNAASRASAMSGMTLEIIRRAAESGHLYGSVTARDVAAALGEHGYTVARSEITLERAIKMVGLFPVRLRFHAEVGAEITVNIARNESEAADQLRESREPSDSADDVFAAKETETAAEKSTENATVNASAETTADESSEMTTENATEAATVNVSAETATVNVPDETTADESSEMTTENATEAATVNVSDETAAAGEGAEETETER
ncbi:MAG: 50S ribosomal protein L9 [Alphaproteobacteria bacterium]|nr:50S ribosomal protein L9 [Alphaproteobacteria bacterium]